MLINASQCRMSIFIACSMIREEVNEEEEEENVKLRNKIYFLLSAREFNNLITSRLTIFFSSVFFSSSCLLFIIFYGQRKVKFFQSRLKKLTIKEEEEWNGQELFGDCVDSIRRLKKLIRLRLNYSTTPQQRTIIHFANSLPFFSLLSSRCTCTFWWNFSVHNFFNRCLKHETSFAGELKLLSRFETS